VAILRILTTEVGAEERVLPLGDSPVRLGRADDNDVVLLEQAASRHHARIEPTDDGYEIVDLGSGGGLTVGGETITRHTLQDGDEVVLGGTRLRFVLHPGSEATILPTTDTPPSSLPTEGPAEPPSEPLGDADTMLPADLAEAAADAHAQVDPALADTGRNTAVGSTVHAPHEPAPPPEPEPAVLPQGTIPAAHQPAPPPAPNIEVEPVEPPKQHPSSNESFVFGGGASTPSNYTLDGAGAPPSGTSGGYSLEGNDDAGVGGVAFNTIPPTTLKQGPGAGVYVMFVLLGAAACFGILVAAQGVPW